MSDEELDALRAIKMQQLRMSLQKESKEQKPPSVELFSTPTCPFCYMAERYLTEKKIPFQKYDVSRDHAAAKRMILATGQTGVPQLHINGQWIIGFDRQAIDEALGL
jgi:glutaredoxin-like YruB-family protein